MGGLFAFLTGIFSLGTGFALSCKEQNDLDLQWEKDVAEGYSYAAQSEYDFNRGRLYRAYFIDDIMKEIQKDYPNMNDYCARQVAEAAVAKKLLEEETQYKYKPSDNCKFFNLNKYAKEEFKKKEEDWCKWEK